MSFALTRPMPEHVFLRRVFKRAALIFLLGVLMYWFPFVTHQPDGSWVAKPFADTRLTGVLQRIALCYLLGALCARYLKPSHLVVVAIGLVVAHWAILVGLSPTGEAFGRYKNAGTLFDLWLIGPEHLYKKDHGFDPEGLLGTLPATANVIAGYLTGWPSSVGASTPRPSVGWRRSAPDWSSWRCCCRRCCRSARKCGPARSSR